MKCLCCPVQKSKKKAARILRNIQAILIIKKSGAFNEKYYRQKAEEKGIECGNPILHYVFSGWKMGLNPHPLFDTEFYIKKNIDVSKGSLNPFAHYIRYGYREDRNCSPGFSSMEYKSRHPDLQSGGEFPFVHYNRVYDTREISSSSDTVWDDFFKAAIETGYFDFEWYCRTYNRSFPIPKDAFLHYVRVSPFCPVSPSPKFDSALYLRNNLDVYHHGMSPLIHYLSLGRQEGRRIGGYANTYIPNDQIEVSAQLSEGAKTLNVAFYLHIFYEDYVERFAGALENFPLDIDLYVAASSDSIAQLASTRFGAHGRIRSLKVCKVPNRGRNFGPMLVEFRDDLKNHDLVCHLHSKKSLYSGREQSQWANYLMEYMISDKIVVTKVLNAFAANPDVGMYYPTSFWMMPSWVNHVLMNQHAMKKWGTELGIESWDDFIAYPVGGMFWVRPDAIHQIMERAFSYSDFPKEPLVNDGSMLHALERMLGLLVEKNGYKQFFYYPGCGAISSDKNYIFFRYKGDFSGTLNHCRHYNHVSFDLFDTLVCREYTFSDYAKYKLGKELVDQGHVQSARGFVALRNQVESDLRKLRNYQGDVSIADIYAQLVTRLPLGEGAASRLMQREFELDLEMLQPKNEMVNFFNDLSTSGHIVTVISDTYYLKEHITQILRKVGISGDYRLMVSSETGLRKDNGLVWELIKERVKASGERYIHIGDNVVADVQRAGDCGLQTLHVLNPIDKWRACGFPAVRKSDLPEEDEILKWGKLISRNGRRPWL
jgi:FMN phosphatase YigB (HAD superfamily)